MIIGEYPVGSPPGIGDSYIDRTVSYSIDEITTFTGVEAIEGGFRYSLNRLSSIYLLKIIDNNYEAAYAASKVDVSSTYRLSIGILDPVRYYTFDCLLQPSYESTVPSTSVLDALVWSYADMFDAIWRQMETMSMALKLEYAIGSDLDDAWGQIFDLPRIVSEDDTSYRDRLKTRTIILNSSGTKSNCEIIIDSIIGSSSTTITTRYPSSVDITFSTEDAIRVAKEKASTLSILIPQMLAFGISYNMYLPLNDYYITSLMKGSNILGYINNFAIGYFDLESMYTVSSAIFFQYEFTYDMKILSKKSKNKTYRIDLLASKHNNVMSYQLDSLIKSTEIMPLEMYNYIRKNYIIHPFIVDQYILKYDIDKSYTIDSLNSNNMPRRYEFSLVLV